VSELREYYQGLNKAGRVAEIVMCFQADRLDGMWSAWEERGLSKEGWLYGRVLERKKELGVSLTEDEEALIVKLRNRQVEGSKLPPISGRGRVGPPPGGDEPWR
jgi:hypothetical protein